MYQHDLYSVTEAMDFWYSRCARIEDLSLRADGLILQGSYSLVGVLQSLGPDRLGAPCRAEDALLLPRAQIP